MDTRTPQRWQRWSFPSLPDAPSLQSVCVCEALSWCLCKPSHSPPPSFPGKKKILRFHSLTHSGRRQEEAEDGLRRKNAWTRPTGDRGGRCALAAGAAPGFYLQRLKQQKAASGNPLAQVCDIPCHVPSFNPRFIRSPMSSIISPYSDGSQPVPNPVRQHCCVQGLERLGD